LFKSFIRAAFAAALFLAGGALAPAASVRASSDLNSPTDTAAVSVTASITPLVAASLVPLQPFKELVINPTNGEIAIGGASVTSSTGILVGTGEKYVVEWSRGRNWYAVRTGGSNVDVRVLPVK
jgi:hypothetical protein